jgi:hypothetical protein
VDGVYMTLSQMAFMTPISQGALFGWGKKIDS